MGMYDESWCAACGTGMRYTENENAMCHNCNEENLEVLETRSSKFMEYMKIHLISLEQDKESIEFTNDEFDNLRYHNVLGQIEATRHLMSVATDIMNSTNERYE